MVLAGDIQHETLNPLKLSRRYAYFAHRQYHVDERLSVGLLQQYVMSVCECLYRLLEYVECFDCSLRFAASRLPLKFTFYVL